MRHIVQLSLVALLACDGTFPSGADPVDATPIGSKILASQVEILCENDNDITTVIQPRIDAGDSIVLSPGTCYVTDTLRVDTSNVTIEGAGPHVTILGFRPLVAKPLFEIAGDSTTPVDNVTLKSIGLRSGKNYDVVKTAVSISYARHVTMEYVNIEPWLASTLTTQTTGIELHGVEHATLRKLRVQGDVPLRIGTAIVPGVHDVSHLHVKDAYLLSNCAPDPVIVIDPGVVLRNVTFAGSQEWRNGGLLWTETQAARWHSSNLRVSNVRVEGLCDRIPAEGATCPDLNNACQLSVADDRPWGIDIQKNDASKLDNLWVEFSLTASRGIGKPQGAASNGVRAYGVARTVLSQVVYEGVDPGQAYKYSGGSLTLDP